MLKALPYAQSNQCSCTPAAMADWCARAPDFGVGPLVTQVHASPPFAPGVTPNGTSSSNHTTSLLGGGGGTTGLLTVTVRVARPSFPAASFATTVNVRDPFS